MSRGFKNDMLVPSVEGKEVSYGPRLKAHRENKKIHQATVAARMKITQPEVSRYERGEPQRPTAEQFRLLAYGYDLPLVTVLMYAGYLTERDVRVWDESGDDAGYAEAGISPDIEDALKKLDELDLPTDVLDAELVVMKHLFRGLQTAGREIEERRASGVAVAPAFREVAADGHEGAPDTADRRKGA